MEMLSPPEETARREEEQEELEQEEVQEVQGQEEEEEQEDFCEAAVATAAAAKIKAGHKEDTANIICALLFHIILLFDSHKRFTFVSVTPIYVVHIMLNVKRKSLPLPLPLSSSSNNRSTRTRNDNETNNDDTQAPISLCVSFAKMGACVCAMWIMRSIFYNDEEFMEGICWAVWITGSIFNLQFLTHDINSLGAVHVAVAIPASHQIRPVFHVLSLTVGWVANILCLMGIVFGGFDMNHGIYGSIPHVFLTVGLLVYIIHSILFGLSICYGHILYECFSDERLLDIIRSRGRHEGEGGENNNDDDICHRLRKDDMVKITCLFLMPVLIVTGNGSGKYRIVEAVFIGGVLYMLYTILEMRTRKANGASSAITTIGTFGGIMLCIGSVFFCLDKWSTAVFGAFWMIGCFCNLFVLNSDLGELTGASRDGQARPIFKVMFVWTSLVGNILNVIGCALFAFRFNPEVGGFLLGCGFIFFFIQPFFLALSIIYGHVVFLIHISTPAARPGSLLGDQPATGMEEFKIPLLDKKNDISCDTIITEYE